MRKQKPFVQSIIFSLFLCALALADAFNATAAERISFKVDVSAVHAYQPVSGRLLIFMTAQTKPLKFIGPDFLNPRSVWIAAVEVHNLEAGKFIEIDPDAL